MTSEEGKGPAVIAHHSSIITSRNDDLQTFGGDLEGHRELADQLAVGLHLRFAGDCATVESVCAQSASASPASTSDASSTTKLAQESLPAREGDELSLWWNEQTAWLWPQSAACEREFLDVSREHALADNAKLREVLDQAARELLLLQCGDWPLSLSVGSGALPERVPPDAASRFAEHTEALRNLLEIARVVARGEFMSEGQRAHLAHLRERDDAFPFLSYSYWLHQ